MGLLTTIAMKLVFSVRVPIAQAGRPERWRIGRCSLWADRRFATHYFSAK
jgi:hypothetical protein